MINTRLNKFICKQCGKKFLFNKNKQNYILCEDCNDSWLTY